MTEERTPQERLESFALHILLGFTDGQPDPAIVLPGPAFEWGLKVLESRDLIREGSGAYVVTADGRAEAAEQLSYRNSYVQTRLAFDPREVVGTTVSLVGQDVELGWDVAVLGSFGVLTLAAAADPWIRDHLEVNRDSRHAFELTSRHRGEGSPRLEVSFDPVATEVVELASLWSHATGDAEVWPLHLAGAAFDMMQRETRDGEVARGVRLLQVALLERLLGGPPGLGLRKGPLSPNEAAATVGAFESAFAGLERVADAGDFAPWDEDFVRNTIHQIHLWRQRDEADPRIFELLMADLVRRFLERLMDPRPVRDALLELGAEEWLADDVAQQFVDVVEDATELGGEDPAVDGRQLDRIADSVDRIAEAVEGIPGVESRSGSESGLDGKAIVGAAAKGAAGAAGGLAMKALVETVQDRWGLIQIGLALGWRTVREWFLR